MQEFYLQENYVRIAKTSKKPGHLIPYPQKEWTFELVLTFLEYLNFNLITEEGVTCSKFQRNLLIRCPSCDCQIARVSSQNFLENIQIFIHSDCHHFKFIKELSQDGMHINKHDFSIFNVFFGKRLNSPFNEYLRSASLHRLPIIYKQLIKDKLLISKKTKSRNQKKLDKTTSLLSYCPTVPGTFYIYNSNKFISGYPSVTQGFCVQIVIWIAPWAFEVAKAFNYYQLDASFAPVKPYVYCVPQMIKDNRAIPLGFSICPTERSELFDFFFKALTENDPVKIVSISKPVLCDMGGGLEKFCKNWNLQRFLCHRHIIQRYNPTSYTGQLVCKMLRLCSEEEFINFLKPTFLTIKNILIAHNGDTSKIHNLDLFLSLIGYKANINISFDLCQNFTGDVSFSISDAKACELWALWLRGNISSCSNTSESFHGHMNAKINKNDALPSQIHLLVTQIKTKFTNFGKTDQVMLYNHKRRYIHTVNAFLQANPYMERYFNKTDCNCSQKQYLEKKYNSNVPCLHCAKKWDSKFTIPPTVILPEFQMENVIIESNSDLIWDLPVREERFSDLGRTGFQCEFPSVSIFIELFTEIIKIRKDLDISLIETQFLTIISEMADEGIDHQSPNFSEIFNPRVWQAFVHDNEVNQIYQHA